MHKQWPEGPPAEPAPARPQFAYDLRPVRLAAGPAPAADPPARGLFRRTRLLAFGRSPRR
ncbi:hypothetical protein [Kitasatospora sp. NPDC085879]|uniref:hypothetical protein n=1 Tax=Kitasatospora sp. NPDC085879 TaxID=3154769 RepID=UPI000BB12621|nr:hypothetical protein [Streptomyces sp. TLI_235]PBC70740.1 hypothetical protein BX265_5295 [Streptomyces sp. TLI_235]